MSDSPSAGSAEQWLWKWFDAQERYTVEQFGIGIVGIGALFFAYAQATFAFLKILIALIGLGGSLTLVMHMYGARMTRDSIAERLRQINGRFAERDKIIGARNRKNQLDVYFSSLDDDTLHGSCVVCLGSFDRLSFECLSCA